ncbi:Ubiquinone biosynthesis protein [Chytridiales sp. JEL 0842]|nr:Ubiquinone biosynthesis protein [Chytridiales sp. JEL 0842]
MVAALGEVTGLSTLRNMRNKMLTHPTGRRILRERPIVSSSTLNLDRLRGLPPGIFGREYVDFLDRWHVSPDTRVEVKYIEDEELGYLMLRHRQSHDFFHTLTGLGVSVEEELALKWLEYVQTSLPVSLLSSLVGPLRLNPEERKRLWEVYVPWAVECARNSEFLLNVYYEEMLEEDVESVRGRIGLTKAPLAV